MKFFEKDLDNLFKVGDDDIKNNLMKHYSFDSKKDAESFRTTLSNFFPQNCRTLHPQGFDPSVVSEFYHTKHPCGTPIKIKEVDKGLNYWRKYLGQGIFNLEKANLPSLSSNVVIIEKNDKWFLRGKYNDIYPNYHYGALKHMLTLVRFKKDIDSNPHGVLKDVVNYEDEDEDIKKKNRELENAYNAYRKYEKENNSKGGKRRKSSKKSKKRSKKRSSKKSKKRSSKKRSTKK